MSVSILMVRALVQAVEQAGVERARLLAAAGMDPRQLDDGEARLSLFEYGRVQHAALELSGDEALGLHVLERTSSGSLHVIGYMTEHAATLREAIEGILRYSRLLSQEPASSLEEHAELATVRFGFPPIDSPYVRMPAELALSGLVRMLRAYVGPDARPRAVRFAYKAPAYHAEYTRIFHGLERFEQPFTGLELDRAWLDATQLHTDPELYTVLKTHAERSLGRLSRADRVATAVEAQLAQSVVSGASSMEQVARQLGMSARSLRRRLAAEGVEYRALVERARMQAAKRMLEDPRSSIQETAFALGFASPAAFHRAFKRWTGTTPKAHKAGY